MEVLRSLGALVRITRPANVLLTVLSVAVGGYCAAAPGGVEMLVACASAALIAAGGYVVNDVFDVETDRKNRPNRPIPSGRISVQMATLWAACLLAAGLALSFLLPVVFRIMAIAVAAALLWYAARLKRTLLWGHLLIAVISGSAFIFGGMLGVDLAPALAPAFLAAGFHLGREMLKAAADYPGDMEQGYDTIAVRWGVESTCRLAAIPLGCVVIASPLPFFAGWFGIFYLLGVLIVVDSILVSAAMRVRRSPTSADAAWAATLLKWGMAAGIAAVWGDLWIRSLTGVTLTLR